MPVSGIIRKPKFKFDASSLPRDHMIFSTSSQNWASYPFLIQGRIPPCQVVSLSCIHAAAADLVK
jgi:hypothetical protein